MLTNGLNPFHCESGGMLEPVALGGFGESLEILKT